MHNNVNWARPIKIARYFYIIQQTIILMGNAHPYSAFTYITLYLNSKGTREEKK